MITLRLCFYFIFILCVVWDSLQSLSFHSIGLEIVGFWDFQILSSASRQYFYTRSCFERGDSIAHCVAYYGCIYRIEYYSKFRAIDMHITNKWTTHRSAQPSFMETWLPWQARSLESQGSSLYWSRLLTCLPVSFWFHSGYAERNRCAHCLPSHFCLSPSLCPLLSSSLLFDCFRRNSRASALNPCPWAAIRWWGHIWRLQWLQ